MQIFSLLHRRPRLEPGMREALLKRTDLAQGPVQSMQRLMGWLEKEMPWCGCPAREAGQANGEEPTAGSRTCSLRRTCVS